MSQNAENPSLRTLGKGWKIGIAIAAGMAALLLLLAFFAFRNGPTAQECELLESKKNRAIGYLENGSLGPHRLNQLPQADALFEELARAKPGDPLPLRNLAITRLLSLQNLADPDLKTEAAAKAVQAARQLIAVDDGSAAAHWLAGKIAALSDDDSLAAAELTRAVELAPDDAAFWFDLFDFQKGSHDEALQARASVALARAYRAAPDNLAVQINWLESQAAANDPDIAQTIQATQAALKRMPGLVANVAARSNGFIADPLAWLAQIQAAAAEGDWATVNRLLRPLANLIRPESWTQSDLRRLQRHPLEYVIHDFQTTCPQRAAAGSPPSAKVTISELPVTSQLPELVGIHDLVLADFDLDDQLDVIVLREKAVEVYGRDHSGRWNQLATQSLDGDFDRLLVADLDRDDPQQPGTEAHRQQQSSGRQAPLDGQRHAEVAARESGAATEAAAPCHRADLDVVVYGPAGIRFLQNHLNDDQTRVLNQVPQEAALGDVRDVQAVLAADFYHDGDLDIAVATSGGLRLWSNRGNLTFTDITGNSQLPADNTQLSALVAVDWDHDIDLDLLTADASGKPAGYLENVRHGQFRWRPYEAGFEELEHATALASFDGQGGSWNLAVAGETGSTVIRTQISSTGMVTPTASQQLSRTRCLGLLAWDPNNDGHLDLLTWTGDTIDFFQGTSSGQLVAMPPLLAAAPPNIRACRAGDLDADGDEDLAVAEADRVVLYSNEGGNASSWIDVELRAGVVDAQTMSFRSNHYGFGSTVEVRSPSGVQRRTVASAKTHFGLNGANADLVRVIWTTGVPQDIVDPGSGVAICDEQVLLGSCPYLYAWDGERFQFCTDCLWSAPLGLVVAEGQLAPSRSWEYLRIEGDKLQPHEGCYPLQITEELWEAAYFDEVRLIAVDHPAGVEVYSNEKVGPAEIARHQVHTAREPRRPIAARDQQGRDVLDRLQRRDDDYVKAFDRRLASGYTEDHYIELDFGDLGGKRQITLFLTGWIFPSGSSMNVAISQNPGLKPPAAPSLWVPDAAGRWREARPFIGFPGGKTKTIAIDLTGVFLSDDCRLRIATNMEIYWDEAFLTVDERPVEVRQIPLELVDAQLHYRGFSQRTPGEHFGPEHYDYNQVSTRPKWPAMRGHFTRYGEVRELLTATDDLLVVLGSGDELTLRFSVPGSPPPGWQRDFLLYNVGWDKDCDLNTVYGETVEPMPYGALSGFPYAAEQQIRDAAGYRRYLQTYQTRRQGPPLGLRQTLE